MQPKCELCKKNVPAISDRASDDPVLCHSCFRNAVARAMASQAPKTNPKKREEVPMEKVQSDDRTNAKEVPLHDDMRAPRWANEFLAVYARLHPDQALPDEDWVMTWFANAIMAGYDTARREREDDQPSAALPQDVQTGRPRDEFSFISSTIARAMVREKTMHGCSLWAKALGTVLRIQGALDRERRHLEQKEMVSSLTPPALEDVSNNTNA